MVNCCTIDWFTPWPRSALLSVSNKVLADMENIDEQQKMHLAELCVEIHESVASAAEKFYQELHRRYYISPKSYLDLIQLYRSLLSKKR